jgi:SAM-dependent methyltransferase
MSEPYRGEPIVHGFTGVGRRLSMMRALQPWRAQMVLDLGSGTGAYTFEIAREARHVVGVDLTRSFVRAFAAHPEKPANAQTALAAAEQLPFSNNAFDAVLSIETIEHVNDEAQTLEEIWRVIKPGGHAIFTLPNKWWLFETHGVRGVRNGHLLPFASWLPRTLHQRIAFARIYTSRDARALFMRRPWRVIGVDWMTPPFDQVRTPHMRSVLQRVSQHVQQTPLRRFGVSIIIAAQKPHDAAAAS